MKQLDGIKLVYVKQEIIPRFYSLTLLFEKDHCVEYVPNVWSTPHKHCGPLAVFKTMRRACEFITENSWRSVIDNGDVEMWECKWVLSRRNTLKNYYFSVIDNKFRISTHLINNPDEACATRIKLVKRVTDIPLHIVN